MARHVPFIPFHLVPLGLLCLLPVQALAQDVINLETVTVEGEKSGEGNGTGPVDGYVASQTTSGSKTSTPLIEIPQAVSVVTRDQLEDRGVQSIGEALNYTAGVSSEPFGRDARFFNPIIRGFSSEQSVYINNFRFIRDFGALAFEPYGLERVEVIKGPASVLYGQAIPGGMVNLIQKKPTGENFGEVIGEIGSDNRYVTKFDMGGVEKDGAVSYRLTALGRLSETQQDYVDDNRIYVAPTFTFSPDADTSFTLLSSLQYDDGQSPLGLPQAGTLDPNPNGHIPSSRYIGDTDFNSATATLATIGYEFRHRLNDTFEFRQNTQYLYADLNFESFYFSGVAADQRTVNRGASFQSEHQGTFNVDNQLETRFGTGALEHTLLTGLDFRKHKQFRSSNFTGGQEPFNVFDPVYGDVDVNYNPANTTISNDDLQQTGIYAQDQIKLGRLTTTLGLRHDWSTITDTLGEGRAEDSATTGRAGAVYLFDNGLAPYVSYSTSFEPLVGRNTDGSTYKPSEGEQWEAGIKFQPPGFNSFVTASVFDITRTNVVASQAQDVGGVLRPVRSQTGEVQSRGFEIEGTASLSDGLSMIVSYAYTDAEVTSGTDTILGGVVTGTTTGNRPINVPEHAAGLWLNYEMQPNTALEGLSFGAGVRYLGERFGNATNTIELPDATLFDAAIRYERGNYKAALNVNNIADKEYVASCNFGCFYGEGRSVIGSLGYKW